MRKAERLCRCLTLAVIPLCAQQPDAAQPEISGVVIDPGINQGIPGVEITISEIPPGLSRTQVAKISSDTQGAFRFQAAKFGRYVLQVRKDGYSRPAGNPLAGVRGMYVTLDRDHPTSEVSFSLVRAGELSGRILDADTGEPIPKLRVMVDPFYYDSGQPRTFISTFASTDGEGQFRAVGLAPGRYLARIFSGNSTGPQLLRKFSEDEAKVVDRVYERSYWPGGGGLDVALPVQVPSGGFSDVGTIKLRKVSYYRVRLSIPASGCVPGRMVNVFVDTSNLGEAPCGRDYLVRNLTLRSHVLTIFGNGEQDVRKHDRIPFELKDNSIELTAALHRGVDLPGQVILAEGTKAFPFDRHQVRTRSATGAPKSFRPNRNW